MFLLIAGVNLDDFRFKFGGEWPVPDPTVKVGGFYILRQDGLLAGPLCVMDDEVLQRNLRVETVDARLTNSLGASLPIISRWSSGMLTYMAGQDLSAFRATDEGDESEAHWSGYSLTLKGVTHRSVMSFSKIPDIVSETYRRDPNCEITVNKRARNGACVTIVFRVSSVLGHKIGYGLFHDKYCLMPRSTDSNAPAPKAIVVPRKPRRFTEGLSYVKDRLGLLDPSFD